jgi:hypothetical protein
MNTKLLSTAALLLGLVGTANAFNKPQPLPLDNFTHLECVQSYEQPVSKSTVYKIEVNLELADNYDVTELSAIHVLRDGTRHDRNDQYGNARVWTKPGHTEWYWNGTRKGNRNVTMGGRLYRTQEGQWVYEEMQFEKGRQSWFMSSQCHYA